MSGLYLTSLEIKPPARQRTDFPFNLPLFHHLTHIDFEKPVTFLVGENGSGKSTLLEAIACAVGSITVGAESVSTDPTLGAVRQLADTFKLTWTQRTRRGFFMRAEDFFGFVKRINQTRQTLQDDLKRVEQEYADRDEFAKRQARMAFAGQLHELEAAYGEGLDTRSHGEAFMDLFQQRFVPGGLYLLDEPETPLSPMHQLSFLTMLHEMIKLDAQFIIATHAPILMAYPQATILNIDGGQIDVVAYDDLEHVSIMRSFLSNPEQYLRHLLND